MKKTFYYLLPLLLVAGLTGCKDAPKEKEKFRITQETNFYLNIEKEATMKADTELKPLPKDQNLSPELILRVADGINSIDTKDGREQSAGIAPSEKDYVNCRIALESWRIFRFEPYLDENGKKAKDKKPVFMDDFFTQRNVRLVANSLFVPELRLKPSEIVGYIPNKVMEEGEKRVREALARDDHEAVYNIFNETYTFIPIREVAYNKLKEEGKL